MIAIVKVTSFLGLWGKTGTLRNQFRSLKGWLPTSTISEKCLTLILMGNQNYLTLKWGTLKSWDFTNSKKGQELLKEYREIGSNVSVMAQHDTLRQKEIICELIDLCDGDTIYLDWDEKDVSKEKAKEYVMNYN